jgi:microfibrillar-associated protein 1
LREDEEYARKTREAKMLEKEERGFLDRTYHKGAFHQDEEIVKRRLAGGEARLEGSVDVGFLPKIMQVKNFGKVSREASSTGGRCVWRGESADHSRGRFICFAVEL